MNDCVIYEINKWDKIFYYFFFALAGWLLWVCDIYKYTYLWYANTEWQHRICIERNENVGYGTGNWGQKSGGWGEWVRESYNLWIMDIIYFWSRKITKTRIREQKLWPPFSVVAPALVSLLKIRNEHWCRSLFVFAWLGLAYRLLIFRFGNGFYCFHQVTRWRTQKGMKQEFRECWNFLFRRGKYEKSGKFISSPKGRFHTARVSHTRVLSTGNDAWGCVSDSEFSEFYFHLYQQHSDFHRLFCNFQFSFSSFSS